MSEGARLRGLRIDLFEPVVELGAGGAVVLDPQCAASWAALGDARNAADSRDAAVDAYRRAIDIAPDLAMAHNNLGVALRALRQFEPAIEAFQRAIALHGEYVDAWLNLVNTIENLDDHAVAIELAGQFHIRGLATTSTSDHQEKLRSVDPRVLWGEHRIGPL